MPNPNLHDTNEYDMHNIYIYLKSIIDHKVQLFTEKGNEISNRGIPTEMHHYLETWGIVTKILYDCDRSFEIHDFTFIGQAIMELNMLYDHLPKFPKITDVYNEFYSV